MMSSADALVEIGTRFLFIAASRIIKYNSEDD